MIKKIAMIFILLFVCNVSFSHAEQTESKSSAQKQKAAVKKKVLKIKPGDVYPGDAAVAGYDEIVIHKVKDTVAGRTYIFSNVEDSYGYFRVLEYYGYGREEENKRDHLIYAERTLLPKTLSTDPLFKIELPEGTLIILLMGAIRDALAVYYYPAPAYSYRHGKSLSHLEKLWYLPGCGVFQREYEGMRDINGDGRLDAIAYLNLEYEEKQSCDMAFIPAIYSFIPYDKDCDCSRFVRVKGKAFEKIFMKLANEMKVKAQAEMRTKTKVEYVQVYIMGWLGGVESTENPILIKQALDTFWKLPDYDDKKKQELLDMLIKHGYSGLKFNNKNP